MFKKTIEIDSDVSANIIFNIGAGDYTGEFDPSSGITLTLPIRFTTGFIGSLDPSSQLNLITPIKVDTSWIGESIPISDFKQTDRLSCDIERPFTETHNSGFNPQFRKPRVPCGEVGF